MLGYLFSWGSETPYSAEIHTRPRGGSQEDAPSSQHGTRQRAYRARHALGPARSPRSPGPLAEGADGPPHRDGPGQLREAQFAPRSAQAWGIRAQLPAVPLHPWPLHVDGKRRERTEECSAVVRVLQERRNLCVYFSQNGVGRIRHAETPAGAA